MRESTKRNINKSRLIAFVQIYFYVHERVREWISDCKNWHWVWLLFSLCSHCMREFVCIEYNKNVYTTFTSSINVNISEHSKWSGHGRVGLHYCHVVCCLFPFSRSHSLIILMENTLYYIDLLFVHLHMKSYIEIVSPKRNKNIGNNALNILFLCFFFYWHTDKRVYVLQHKWAWVLWHQMNTFICLHHNSLINKYCELLLKRWQLLLAFIFIGIGFTLFSHDSFDL